MSQIPNHTKPALTIASFSRNEFVERGASALHCGFHRMRFRPQKRIVGPDIEHRVALVRLRRPDGRKHARKFRRDDRNVVAAVQQHDGQGTQWVGQGFGPNLRRVGRRG